MVFNENTTNTVHITDGAVTHFNSNAEPTIIVAHLIGSAEPSIIGRGRDRGLSPT
jgi:hypothetical protein